MIVQLRNPRRELVLEGTRRVNALLDELGLNREAHLVICNGTLITGDVVIDADATVEIRPVISGGS
jgi:sulfur carrier protein